MQKGRKRQGKDGITTSSGWSEDSVDGLNYFFSFLWKFLITLDLISHFFLPLFLEGSISLIYLPRMHLNPPLGQSLFLTWMLVPSKSCWGWWNVLLAVKSQFSGHFAINAAS